MSLACDHRAELFCKKYRAQFNGNTAQAQVNWQSTAHFSHPFHSSPNLVFFRMNISEYKWIYSWVPEFSCKSCLLGTESDKEWARETQYFQLSNPDRHLFCRQTCSAVLSLPLRSQFFRNTQSQDFPSKCRRLKWFPFGPPNYSSISALFQRLKAIYHRRSKICWNFCSRPRTCLWDIIHCQSECQIFNQDLSHSVPVSSLQLVIPLTNYPHCWELELNFYSDFTLHQLPATVYHTSMLESHLAEDSALCRHLQYTSHSFHTNKLLFFCYIYFPELIKSEQFLK